MCLAMEIAEHFIGTPSTDETDHVGVNLCTKKGIGSRCTKAAGGYIGR